MGETSPCNCQKLALEASAGEGKRPRQESAASLGAPGQEPGSVLKQHTRPCPTRPPWATGGLRALASHALAALGLPGLLDTHLRD